MRKVILQEFVTLNGLASGPNGSTDFIPAGLKGDQSFGRDQLLFIDTIDLILLGRKTYEMFAGYWPNVREGDDDKPFADQINATPKTVFTRSLESVQWGKWNNAHVNKGDPADEVAKLRRQSGKGKDMIVWGSLTLADSLIKAKLIDEYRLVVVPTVLPAGKSLFNAATMTLRLMDAKVLDRGGVALTYIPA